MNEPPNIEDLRHIVQAQLPPTPSVDELMRAALPPEMQRPLTPEEQAEVDAIEAELRRLMDEPQPAPTPESKAQGMTAAAARADLEAMKRSTDPKE